MAKPAARQESLSIYLAKEGLEDPASCIKVPDGLAQFEIKDENGPLGTLYVEARTDKPPRWARFFVPQIRPAQLGRVSSTAAVLHIRIDGRAVLLTFGQGRHLLHQACWEERFGLRVTLNSIGGTSVRSIDKHTLDTVGRHTRVQVSKESAPSEFGIDTERDIIRAITGTPLDRGLGNNLSGFESMHINATVTIETLRELLHQYLEQFKLETFKETFPWVDHVSEVKESTLKTSLDALMLQAIVEHRSDKCWLALPEPIEWHRVAGFRYGGSRSRPLRNDIDLASFIADLQISENDIAAEFLITRDIYGVDGDDIKQYSWSAYKCVYCEADYAGNTYILNTGKWYKIATSFVAQTNDYVLKIPKYEHNLPPYADATEEAYNARVATIAPNDYHLMDQKFIYIGGGHSKIEFCDLIRAGGDIIHVKRYGGSGVLSHLFSQAVVSGQMFVSDLDFRKSANPYFPTFFQLNDVESRPNPDSYKIVFAIVSKDNSSKLTLPFFSRLSLRNAAHTLRGYGYKVALAKIPVEEVFSRTARFTRPRKAA
jgi:uncharacterized protein (TIGR04141 family)